MVQHKLRYILILALASIVMNFSGITCQNDETAFFDTTPQNKVSYLYVPGLTGTEMMMGRYCPSYTASTGEKITWGVGGHVIGSPHSAVIFPETDLRKPGFTLNPIKAYMNSARRDLFPLVERFFGDTYGIKVEDNPNSHHSVVHYSLKFNKANIGQKRDIKALRKAYKAHGKQFPNTDIVLFGLSRGAATIFSFLAQHNPERVKAAVVEGIFDSVPHCIKHFLYNDKGERAEDRLHQMLSLVMGGYRKNGINPRKTAEIIRDDIPLLLVTSLKDGLVAPQCTIYLYKRLKERGHKKVHLLVLEKSLHPAYMIDDAHDKEAYETVVHAFYKNYGLSHNSAKAAQGEKAFLATQPSAQELDKKYTLPTCQWC